MLNLVIYVFEFVLLALAGYTTYEEVYDIVWSIEDRDFVAVVMHVVIIAGTIFMCLALGYMLLDSLSYQGMFTVH